MRRAVAAAARRGARSRPLRALGSSTRAGGDTLAALELRARRRVAEAEALELAEGVAARGSRWPLLYEEDGARAREGRGSGAAGEQEMVEVSDAGEVERRKFEKHEVAAALGLPKRDLRQIDSGFRNIPSILVRDGRAIVVNMEFLKAVITAAGVIVLDPWHPNVQVMLPKLQARLADPARDRAKPEESVELLALECILKAVCRRMERRLATFEVAVNPILESSGEERDPRIMARLLPIKYGLHAFDVSVREASAAIREVLASDEDMAAAYVTTRAATGHARRLDQHHEVEELLENYLRQLDEISNEVAKIKSNVSSTEDMVHIHLDTQRNQIMKLDLVLQMGTFGVSSGALAAGIFGANLLSGLEGHPYAFYLMSGAIVVGSGGVVGSCLRMARRRGIL